MQRMSTRQQEYNKNERRILGIEGANPNDPFYGAMKTSSAYKEAQQAHQAHQAHQANQANQANQVHQAQQAFPAYMSPSSKMQDVNVYPQEYSSMPSPPLRSSVIMPKPLGEDTLPKLFDTNINTKGGKKATKKAAKKTKKVGKKAKKAPKKAAKKKTKKAAKKGKK